MDSARLGQTNASYMSMRLSPEETVLFRYSPAVWVVSGLQFA
jgi:hypothetical protein